MNSRATPAERDEFVMWQRHLAGMRDHHDTETEAELRWHLRAQARAAITMFRAGRAPRPHLRGHRLQHSDATRREFVGSSATDPYEEATT